MRFTVAAVYSCMAGLLAAGNLWAAEDPLATTTTLTIYGTGRPAEVSPQARQQNPSVSGYAFVKQERSVELNEPRSTVRFTDVAARIEPTTVMFESLTDANGTRVLEQSYEYDLVGAQRLLERYIDREIMVEQARGDGIESFQGKLLSTTGGIILQDSKAGLVALNGYANIRFPELPGGLITRPTLVWDIASRKQGLHRTRITYETKGLAWWADYNLVFEEGANANAGKLDIGAWVSIVNESGATYRDARLKLVAGDVQRAPEQNISPVAMRGKAKFSMAAVSEEGFSEKEFFEYHLYTLGRNTTIPDRSTKQLELFSAAMDVPCEKILLYTGIPNQGWHFPSPMTDRNFGVQSNPDVDVYLKFDNKKDVGLGIPLPAGRIRVSKLDPADSSLEFIGEDHIDHTPKDETVLIKMGSAFDVVGQRVQKEFSIDERRKTMEETVEIKVRNHKQEPVRVVVKENLYRWTNWEIQKNNKPFEKVDARTIHFPLVIEKDGEGVVEFTVRYSW